MNVFRKRIANKIVSDIVYEIPFEFEKLPVVNFAYQVKEGEEFTVFSHEGATKATVGMWIVTSFNEDVGTWCMPDEDFHKNYESMVKAHSCDSNEIKVLNGQWHWRGEGYRGDEWKKKSRKIVMFRTAIDITGIDCGWAVLDAKAGDWIEISDGKMSAPHNSASIKKDFSILDRVEVPLPDDYLKIKQN